MRRIDHSFCRMNRVLCVRVFVMNQFGLCPADWEGGLILSSMLFLLLFPFSRFGVASKSPWVSILGFHTLHFFCSLTGWKGSLDNLTTTLIFNFWSCRLEDAVSREDTERTEKLEKWGEITKNASRIIFDGRSKLDRIKSKDPQTTPEIQKELQEIQVKTFYIDVKVRQGWFVSFNYEHSRTLGHSVLAHSHPPYPLFVTSSPSTLLRQIHL